MTVQESDVTRHSLRTAVAQVCLAMGWSSIHSQPLDIMVEVLHRYIAQIGRGAQARAELYGRTDSNLLDLSQVFESLGVSLPDLEEYVEHFQVAPAKDVPAFPKPANDDLNILKPGSREVLHRPQHVHSHLPAMYPELEEQEEGQEQEQEGKEKEELVTPSKRKLGEQAVGGGADVPKQPDDGCPLREISSVMMTSSGFLSPCREGKMPDSKRPHVDPEEKKAVSRRHGDAGKKTVKKDIYNRDAMIKQEMMAASEVKQELPDYDEEDFEDHIEVQQVGGRGGGGNMLDQVMEGVIKKGIIESEKRPQVKVEEDSDEFEVPEDMMPTVKPKKEVEKGAKKGKGRAPARGKGAGAGGQQGMELFSAPQHFTAGGAAKSPKAKMARIPKITEKVSLPTPDSLGLGANPLIPGANPLIPGGNPLIPNPLMNFYGFGGMPGAAAGLIPGLTPNLLGQMAMMQQVQAAASGLGDSDITAEDEELEEGEISPPSTPTAVSSFPIKKEKSPDNAAEILREKEKQEKKERELEKEKERKEREKEREKEKEAEERRKLAILTQERDRLKEVEEQRAREREKEREREREKEAEKAAEKVKEREKIKEREAIERERLKQEKRDFEKEKKKAKKDKKDKEKDKPEKEKTKKEMKKEKKEKKKEKKEKKEKKPDEPTLFAPVPLLKIKPLGSTPSSTSTSSTPSKPPEPSPDPPATPKLVIKNLAKATPVKEAKKEKEQVESVPMLGFQPLRTGPARTPKAEPSPAAAKPGEKRKASRPPGRPPGPVTPKTPAPGPSKEKKVKEGKRVKSKETVESVDSGEDTPPVGIISETVGSYTDEAGNKVWICPACGKQDDGSPMIGCDQCDDWYHWLCVGINSEPSENQDWFCTRCMAKKQGLYLDQNATFHPKQRRK